MSTKILTSQTFEAAAKRLVELWDEVGRPQPMRLEGFDGVGKTGIAKLVAASVNAEHVEGDLFVNRYDSPPPYSQCIRQAEFDAAIARAIATGRTVILDAVCLEEVAPGARWGRGLIVYVKRLSFNNCDPIWHHGLHLEDAAPTSEVRRSIHLYHNQMRPHETADVIVELPNAGHTMTKGKFSRDWCFDPPGSVLVDVSGTL